jgi:hypothetical protein
MIVKICSSETSVDFAGLHDVISQKAQKIELIIVPLDLALDGSVMRDVTVAILPVTHLHHLHLVFHDRCVPADPWSCGFWE